LAGASSGGGWRQDHWTQTSAKKGDGEEGPEGADTLRERKTGTVAIDAKMTRGGRGDKKERRKVCWCVKTVDATGEGPQGAKTIRTDDESGRPRAYERVRGKTRFWWGVTRAINGSIPANTGQGTSTKIERGSREKKRGQACLRDEEGGPDKKRLPPI